MIFSGFEQGWTFCDFRKTSFYDNFKNVKISNGTYNTVNSPDLKIQIGCICAVEILDIYEDIAETIFFKNYNMLNPGADLYVI